MLTKRSIASSGSCYQRREFEQQDRVNHHSDIDNSAAFDTADSTSATDALNNITPKIVTVLTDLGNKASVVASAGFASIVLSAVQDLKTNTDALFVALESKADSGDVAAITADQRTVDAAFNTAIADF